MDRERGGWSGALNATARHWKGMQHRAHQDDEGVLQSTGAGGRGRTWFGAKP
ncbi:hypothetical protein SAMN05443999_10139 [Roseovarius azorensis]|uniref:Uncharacterized protein n=1 Tax=Roseovarius azorensis TaxID=1287727 RepID=A0A1H7FBD1_9RHOB|nr:hypothetical protein SAMN05443999_10139 [Roseovarius azorensis]